MRAIKYESGTDRARHRVIAVKRRLGLASCGVGSWATAVVDDGVSIERRDVRRFGRKTACEAIATRNKGAHARFRTIGRSRLIWLKDGACAGTIRKVRQGQTRVVGMIRTVARFEIGYSRCLDPEGRQVAPLPAGASNPGALLALYRALIRTRCFDAKAIALQRTGRLGTYASSLGQEAVSVGAASAMRAEDVLLPSFCEHGAQLWRA